MEVKTFAATLVLGLLAGATAAMLLPKESKVYRTANSAVQMVKDEISDAVNSLKEHS